MKIIPLYKLCKQDYHVKFLSYITMPQAISNPTFSCISNPKKQDLLLYINDCVTLYHTKSGNVLTTKPGNIVYIPTGSEYEVTCISDNPHSSTFQINLNFFDEEGDPIRLSDEILIFNPKNNQLKDLFEQLSLLHSSPSPLIAEKKSILYMILSILTKDILSNSTPAALIQPGVDYIFTHYHERPKISDIAKLCYISPEYFRKLFQEYFKVSPTKYINTLRLNKAKEYLIYSDFSIEQIADTLNYCTATHFISQFKSHFKTTPLNYRAQYK